MVLCFVSLLLLFRLNGAEIKIYLLNVDHYVVLMDLHDRGFMWRFARMDVIKGNEPEIN